MSWYEYGGCASALEYTLGFARATIVALEVRAVSLARYEDAVNVCEHHDEGAQSRISEYIKVHEDHLFYQHQPAIISIIENSIPKTAKQLTLSESFSQNDCHRKTHIPNQRRC